METKEIICHAVLITTLVLAGVAVYFAIKIELMSRKFDRTDSGISKEAMDVMDDTYRIEFDQR